MNNCHIPYANMIESISELLLISKQSILLESQISFLLSDNLSDNEKRKILNVLNPNLKNNIYALYSLKKK